MGPRLHWVAACYKGTARTHILPGTAARQKPPSMEIYQASDGGLYRLDAYLDSYDE